MRRAFVTILLVTAAATGATAQVAPPADSIEYALADTVFDITLDLALEGCATHPATLGGVGDSIRVKPTVTLAPVAQASPLPSNRFRLSGANLASWWQKRDLAVTLYDNGTLKSVGATSADRTAAIVANVIKLGTTLAGLGVVSLNGEHAPTPPRCTSETARTVAELTALRSRIRQLQDSLAGTLDPQKIKNSKDAIDKLAQRAAELRNGPDGPLFLSLKTRLTPPARPGTVTVAWPADSFKKWFGEDAARGAGFAGLQVSFEPAPPAVAPVADAPSTNLKRPFIVVREPVLANVSVAPAAGVHANGFDSAKAKTKAWIGQWGGKSYYQVRAGFGESKKLALELDPFGRKTSMTVNRDARAEAISGGLAGIGDAALAYQTATSETRSQELRIKELETQQKYNKIKLCEAIIEEGGFTCP